MGVLNIPYRQFAHANCLRSLLRSAFPQGAGRVVSCHRVTAACILIPYYGLVMTKRYPSRFISPQGHKKFNRKGEKAGEGKRNQKIRYFIPSAPSQGIGAGILFCRRAGSIQRLKKMIRRKPWEGGNITLLTLLRAKVSPWGAKD
jgi:hypothetical protein